jgi:hypothetical protein
LLFAVHKDIDDLRFLLEHLDQRVDKIESMLSTLLQSLHSPDLGTNSLASPGAVLSPNFQGEDEQDVDTCAQVVEDKRYTM